eukprot:m.463568 g.463568  ORF g.463568 m.463568 type:complete len:323 (-) comp23075_c0_seq1:27-995(-)
MALRGGGGTGRLRQLLSHANIASKWEAERYVRQGWVRHSDRLGELGPEGLRRDGSVVMPVDGGKAHVRLAAPAVQDQVIRIRSTLVLNKPYSFLSHAVVGGKSRSRDAKTILVPGNRVGLEGNPSTHTPASIRDLVVSGRLDSDSTGVLLFTRSGLIARLLSSNQALVDGVPALDKEYLVRVDGADGLPQRKLDALVDALGNGSLTLDDSAVRPAEVRWLHPGLLQFVLTEGRHRQIRRMCEQVGLKVNNLKRVRVGGLALGRLPIGKWRPATIEELLPNPAQRYALLPLVEHAIRPRRPRTRKRRKKSKRPGAETQNLRSK